MAFGRREALIEIILKWVEQHPELAEETIEKMKALGYAAKASNLYLQQFLETFVRTQPHARSYNELIAQSTSLQKQMKRSGYVLSTSIEELREKLYDMGVTGEDAEKVIRAITTGQEIAGGITGKFKDQLAETTSEVRSLDPRLSHIADRLQAELAPSMEAITGKLKDTIYSVHQLGTEFTPSTEQMKDALEKTRREMQEFGDAGRYVERVIPGIREAFLAIKSELPDVTADTRDYWKELDTLLAKTKVTIPYSRKQVTAMMRTARGFKAGKESIEDLERIMVPRLETLSRHIGWSFANMYDAARKTFRYIPAAARQTVRVRKWYEDLSTTWDISSYRLKSMYDAFKAQRTVLRNWGVNIKDITGGFEKWLTVVQGSVPLYWESRRGLKALGYQITALETPAEKHKAFLLETGLAAKRLLPTLHEESEEYRRVQSALEWVKAELAETIETEEAARKSTEKLSDVQVEAQGAVKKTGLTLGDLIERFRQVKETVPEAMEISAEVSKVETPEVKLPEIPKLEIEAEVPKVEPPEIPEAAIPELAAITQTIYQKLAPVLIPEVGDKEQVIRQQLETVTIPIPEDLVHTITQRIIEEEVKVPEELDQIVRQEFVTETIPIVDDQIQNIVQKLAVVTIPRVEPLEQTVQQVLEEVKIPLPEVLSQRIVQEVVQAKIEKPEDLEQIIRQELDGVLIPDVEDLTQRITQILEPAAIPSIEDIRQRITQVLEETEIPIPADMKLKLIEELVPVEIRAPEDLQVIVRQSLEKAEIPVTEDQVQKITQQLELAVLPSVKDQVQTIRQLLEEVVIPIPADLTQRIAQKVIEARIEVPEELQQIVKQELVSAEIPATKDRVQEIVQRLVPITIPRIERYTQTIQQVLETVKIPVPEDITQRIIQQVIETDIERPEDLSQIIKQEFLEVEIPEIEDKVQQIVQRLQPVIIPSVEDMKQRITQVLESATIPAPEDVIQNIVQRIVKAPIETPEALTQAIVQELIRAEITPMRDLVQTITQRLEPVVIPQVEDRKQTIRQILETVEIPIPDELVQRIIQVLEKAEIPPVPDLVQKIVQRLTAIEITKPEDLAQVIIQELREAEIPVPKGQIQQIAQELRTVEIPTVADTEQKVKQVLETVRIPLPEDFIQTITQKVTEAEIKKPADLIQLIRLQVAPEITIPKIPQIEAPEVTPEVRGWKIEAPEIEVPEPTLEVWKTTFLDVLKTITVMKEELGAVKAEISIDTKDLEIWEETARIVADGIADATERQRAHLEITRAVTELQRELKNRIQEVPLTLEDVADRARKVMLGLNGAGKITRDWAEKNKDLAASAEDVGDQIRKTTSRRVMTSLSSGLNITKRQREIYNDITNCLQDLNVEALGIREQGKAFEWVGDKLRVLDKRLLEAGAATEYAVGKWEDVGTLQNVINTMRGVWQDYGRDIKRTAALERSANRQREEDYSHLGMALQQVFRAPPTRGAEEAATSLGEVVKRVSDTLRSTRLKEVAGAEKLSKSERKLIEEHYRERKAVHDLEARLKPYVSALFEVVTTEKLAGYELDREVGYLASVIRKRGEDEKGLKKWSKSLDKGSKKIKRLGRDIGFYGWILSYSTRAFQKFAKALESQFYALIAPADKWADTLFKTSLALAKARRFGIEFGDAQAYLTEMQDRLMREGPALQAQYEQLQAVLQNVQWTIASALAPTMEEAANVFARWIAADETRQVLLELANVILYKLVPALPTITEATLAFFRASATLTPILARVLTYFDKLEILGVRLGPIILNLGTVMFLFGPIITAVYYAIQLLSEAFKGASWAAGRLGNVFRVSATEMWNYTTSTTGAVAGTTRLATATSFLGKIQTMVAATTARLTAFLRAHALAIIGLGASMIASISFFISAKKNYENTLIGMQKAVDYRMPKIATSFSKTLGGSLLISGKQLEEFQKRFSSATEGLKKTSEKDIFATSADIAAATVEITDELGNVIYTWNTMTNIVKDAQSEIVGTVDPTTGQIVDDLGNVWAEIDIVSGKFTDLRTGAVLEMTNLETALSTPLSNIETGLGDVSTSLGVLGTSFEDMRTTAEAQMDLARIGVETNATLMVAAINPVAGGLIGLIFLLNELKKVGEEQEGAFLDLIGTTEEQKKAIDLLDEGLEEWGITSKASGNILDGLVKVFTDLWKVLTGESVDEALVSVTQQTGYLNREMQLLAAPTDQMIDRVKNLTTELSSLETPEIEVPSLEPLHIEPFKQTVQVTREVESLELEALSQNIFMTYRGQLEALEPLEQTIQMAYKRVELVLPELMQRVKVVREVALEPLTQEIVYAREKIELIELEPLIQRVSYIVEEYVAPVLSDLAQQIKYVRDPIETIQLPDLIQHVLVVRDGIISLELQPLTQRIMLIRSPLEELDLPALEQNIHMIREPLKELAIQTLVQSVEYSYERYVFPRLERLTQSIQLEYERFERLELDTLMQKVNVVFDITPFKLKLPELTQIIEVAYEFPPISELRRRIEAAIQPEIKVSVEPFMREKGEVTQYITMTIPISIGTVASDYDVEELLDRIRVSLADWMEGKIA